MDRKFDHESSKYRKHEKDGIWKDTAISFSRISGLTSIKTGRFSRAPAAWLSSYLLEDT